jgi:D-lactate dehydrogenase
MKVTVFSAKSYDRQFLDRANAGRHELRYLEQRLTPTTADLAEGTDAVCLFSRDRADGAVLDRFAQLGIKLIALRSAGFDNVDLDAAAARGIVVCRVPAYSPHAVAEHTFALLLSLIRKVHRAHERVKRNDFSLDGLLGFDLAGKTIGIVGTGYIGTVVAQIARGFGCNVLGCDPCPSAECERIGVRYCNFEELLSSSDIVTLHCPLNDGTRHLLDQGALSRMKAGAILVNTSRGAVVDTSALLCALETRHLGGAALDVYENEHAIFFEDRSDEMIEDQQFIRLRSLPNVLITGHQGYFTVEALSAIARTTIANVDSFERSGMAVHPLEPSLPHAEHEEQYLVR